MPTNYFTTKDAGASDSHTGKGYFNASGNWTIAVASNVVTVDLQGVSHGFTTGHKIETDGNWSVNAFMANLSDKTITVTGSDTFTFPLTQANQGATTETDTDAMICSAFATVDKGESTISSGDTLWIRAGTYLDTTNQDARVSGVLNRFFFWIPNGPSTGNYTAIRGYPGETVILKNTIATAHFIVKLKQSAAHVWLDNLTVDGDNLGSTSAVTALGPGYQGNNSLFNEDIKLTNLTLKKFSNQGLQTNNVRNCPAWTNITIQDNVTKGDQFCHGIYISGATNGLEIYDLDIQDISGHGIQIFQTDATPTNNLIDRFRVKNAGVKAFTVLSNPNVHKPNIITLNANSNTLRNGVTYDGHSSGVHLGGNGNAMQHVISYANGKSSGNDGSGGLAIISGTGNKLQNCITLDQHANAGFPNLFDGGTSSVLQTNISSTYVLTDLCNDPANGDFTYITPPVTANEIAFNNAVVDQGTSVGAGSDLAGTARPQGAAVDIGPYEYAADPPDVPMITHSSPVLVSSAETWASLGLGVVDDDAADSDTVTGSIDSAGEASVRLTSTEFVLVDV